MVKSAIPTSTCKHKNSMQACLHISVPAIALFLLTSHNPANSQANSNVDVPPPAITPVTTTDVPPPNQIKPMSPLGETPFEPSMPPTDFVPPAFPTVSVTGGVDVPVGPNMLRLDADAWRVDLDSRGCVSKAVATGHVRAIYQEFRVTSDTATADMTTKIATFSGHVFLNVSGQDICGSCLTINMSTKEWGFQGATSKIKPELFPEYIQAPVYLSGDSITGYADRTVEVKGGGFTTCDLAHPHYFIGTKEADVWTDRKLVARDTSFYALGRLILKLNRIAIPIKQIRDRSVFTPLIGQTQEEGFFLKTSYTALASLRNTGNVKLDLMTAKGVGLGFDDNYTLDKGKGNLWIYQLYDRTHNTNSLTGRFSHEQQLGTIQARLATNYRANSYQYSPTSQSLNGELRLSRNRNCASTMLGIGMNQTIGFGTFSTLTSNFQHNQTFGTNRTLLVAFDFYRSMNPIFVSGVASNAVNSQLVTRFDYGQRNNLFNWNFRVNKISDLSDEAFIRQSGNRFAGTEMLPELALSTSSDQMKRNLLFGLPTSLDLTFGQYREDLGRVDTSRATVGVDVPNKIYKLADKLTLGASAGFKQYVYGDDTAQYSTAFASDLTKKIGKESSASLNYRYLRHRGFTPFRFDFIGDYNILNGRVNIKETDNSNFSLYSGYDFGQPDFKWQDITARATFRPSPSFLFYASTGYNPNRSQWRSLINQVRVRLDSGLKVDLGTRYDIQEGKFAAIKGQLDTPINDLWHVRANAGYNGFTGNFDYTNVQLVRDLHCWELAISYVNQQGFWNEKGIRLNLRIKAFPLFDNFGVGQFGQGLDSSVGEVL